MNYVKHLNLFDVEAKEIPCVTGDGAPTTATVGAVGLLYMDNLTGDLYKCTAAADGVYTWVKVGEKGEQGDPGEKGETGAQGIQGIQGEKGDKGDQGDTGAQGPQGIQGEPGPAGEKGDKGDPGEPGAKGDKGDTGPQGEQGPKGDTGETGPQGPKGDTGETGPQGPQGEQGIQGPAGKDGAKGDTGATGPQGEQGPKGDKGDKGDTGPQGPKGDTGEKGETGPKGEQGNQGPKGDQGEKGDKGDTGAKGDKGDPGEQGPQGIQGPAGEKGDKGDTGATGPQGPKGDTGAAGKDAPQEAVLYSPQTLTDAQKAQARTNIGVDTYLAEELAKRGQLKPEFANSVEECTDTSKLYVLPDGFIYANLKYTEEVEGGVVPAFTNLKNQCIFKYNARFSSSSGWKTGIDASYNCTAILVPVPTGKTEVTIRFKDVSPNISYTAVYYLADENTFGGQAIGGKEFNNTNYPSVDGVRTIPCTKSSDSPYIVFNLAGTSASVFADIIVTVDEPIEYTTSTETVTKEGFANTGHAFVPADYEDRIIELEKKAEVIGENTNRIGKLESQIGTADENAVVHKAVGATFPNSQKPAAPEFAGYDIDIHNSTANEVYAYIDEAINGKNTVTKEIVGKDASGKYDIARYIYANREHCAWVRQNHPKMYAWKNGSTIIYSVSVSPRIGDTMYSTTYIGTAYNTITAVSATNRSRTVNGLAFVRYESGDTKPTVIYTDMDDERNGNTSIVQDGITYNRYPLGDLGANRRKLIPIFIYANEHGVEMAGLDSSSDRYQKYETKMCALVAARFLRDLTSGKQANNALYKYIRENCMVIIIPVANPFGFNMPVTGDTNSVSNGYYNVNTVNINRNYDTPGWDHPDMAWNKGSYAGSENETQYIMNTMVESGAVVAMSLHGLGSWEGYCAHQGQSPDGTDYNQEKLEKVVSFLRTNYGYTLRYYDYQSDGVTPAVAVNTPDITSKSPSYITQCGAYGGIIEFSPDDVKTSGWKQEMKSSVIENAYAQMLNLTAMWLSDYLEQQTN